MGMAILAKSLATGFLCRRSSSFCTLTLAVVLVGCGGEARWKPEAVYLRADEYRRAGDLPKALQQAQMGFSAWRRKPLTAWHWRFRLLTAELLFVQKETQEAFSLLRDAPPLDVPDHDRLQARLVNDLGYAAISQQKYSEARELLDHAYDLACKSSFQD